MNNSNLPTPIISDDDLAKINTIYQRGHTILREIRAVIILVITLIVVIAALFGHQITIDNQLLNALGTATLSGGGGGNSLIALVTIIAIIAALSISIITPLVLIFLARHDRH